MRQRQKSHVPDVARRPCAGQVRLGSPDLLRIAITMKSTAIQSLRRKLADQQPVHGLWVTLESPSLTEMAVALGVDWVVIDAEHGHLDWKEVLEHIRATVRSDTVALVRIAELNAGLIKRALDIGADGVVVPWIETPEQLRQAVAFATYPPAGLRGAGAERATGWGQAFTQHVDEARQVLVVPIIESVKGAENIEALCQVPGVDIFQLGPADFSATAGYPGQWEGPGVAARLLAVKDCVRRHGKHCGVLARHHDDLTLRHEQGFRFLGLGLDSAFFLRALRGALAHVGKDRAIRTSFAVEAAKESTVLDEVPARMKPDRSEVMNTVAESPSMEIERGVLFRALVGSHNKARNLTTGIVTFAPEAALPYHTHPFSESVTLLEGQATLEVEGRAYRLRPLDNITIPRDTPHAVVNASAGKSAVLHIAMASDAPTRTLVSTNFGRTPMGEDVAGVAGKERVNRHDRTPRCELAPRAYFQDCFNRELGCPDMSGGYGLFEPGARLPCHLHDFDESICIVQGTATCLVEGRRYSLSDNGTALVPRGRCHYFINESDAPMAMIWVYAGPMPERILMNEKCCAKA
jgi:2-keto-3-deoxy-L-rhamnonate aldolase RhmA/quercetin dioxygenase-like cupin family protein